ncbi:MAG: hypothetical protein HDR47_08125 [Bacteroides sp.]|nr:hypothetical protein [Bacteroides sp.]
MEIDVNTFYHCQPLYKYMPRPLFDALEAAFLAGQERAVVSAADFETMKEEAPADVWPE